MPAKRELTMRQLRQMLRLHHDGVSTHEIGRTLGVARSTIRDNLARAAKAGLAWPLAGDLTDDILEERLSISWCCEKSIGRRIPTAMATAASAICSASSSGGCRR